MKILPNTYKNIYFVYRDLETVYHILGPNKDNFYTIVWDEDGYNESYTLDMIRENFKDGYWIRVSKK